MKSMGMLPAYGVAALGSATVATLANPEITGYRALGIGAFGVLLWGFSVAEAMIAVSSSARLVLEAEREKPMYDLFRPHEPAPLARYPLQVEQARWVYVDLPGVEPERLDVLASGLLKGRPFSEREWRGRIRDFRGLQDEFIRRGLAKPKGSTPQQGYKLTREGWEAIGRIGHGKGDRAPHPA